MTYVTRQRPTADSDFEEMVEGGSHMAQLIGLSSIEWHLEGGITQDIAFCWSGCWLIIWLAHKKRIAIKTG